MPRVEVRPFEDGDLDQAARLLAARQRRDRERFSFLPARFEDAAACAAIVAAFLARTGARGAVARRGREVVGFLAGAPEHHAPSAFLAYFSPPGSITMPSHGHAVSDERSAGEVYRALYAALAETWVAHGHFHHVVYCSAGDRAVEDAWAGLGFGRAFVTAVRGTQSVADPGRADLEVRRASVAELADVIRLSRELRTYQVGPPMFLPYPPAIETGWDATHAELLKDGEGNPHFLAFERGRAVGMQLFTPPFALPPLQVPERMIYLFIGVVGRAVRGGGVGRTLLAHAMDRLREAGYEHCALHFLSANPTGGPFWTGRGFLPVDYGMVRHLDERIAWARGGPA